jgi:hypothetical protein
MSFLVWSIALALPLARSKSEIFDMGEGLGEG